MSTKAAAPALRTLERAELQPFLRDLDHWLLPGTGFSVQHTWPQLYRSDGHGRFLGWFAGDRLVSHLAWRLVDARGAHGPLQLALLGSVATAPQWRGQGLAGALLARAIDDTRAAGADAVLLWASRTDLYERAGFTIGEQELAMLVGRRAHAHRPGVRSATIVDHDALHALHARKPWAVQRTRSEMSGLLTTPGAYTFVLERGGAIVAYAVCGKGADLQGWWHELGGDDVDVAELLQGAMHLLDVHEAVVLLPSYRTGLLAVLGGAACETFAVDGPMRLRHTGSGTQRLFVDGLDSV